jgi:hypothetical protein
MILADARDAEDVVQHVFTGTALRFARAKESYTIYSVDADQKEGIRVPLHPGH